MKRWISMLIALSVLAALAVPFLSMAAMCSHVYKKEVLTAATCEGEGEAKKTCTKCGNTFTEVIAPHGHTNSIVWDFNEECTEMWHNCRFCGKEGTHRPYVAPNTEPGRVEVIDGGIYVDGVMMNGSAGIVYYDAFSAYLADDTDYARDSYLEQWNMLIHDYGINYIRFDAISYHYTAFEKYWVENRDVYWAKMDRFIADAEECGMMLIPSIVWSCFMPAELCGEDYTDVVRDTSDAYRVTLSVYEEYVMRYKDSPAILMWELGNEHNYNADLDEVLENGHAYMDLADVERARADFAAAIRYFDPHRPITSGDGSPRSSQWNLYEHGTWEKDTYEDFVKALSMLNPDGVDVISIHAYDWLEPNGSSWPYYDQSVFPSDTNEAWYDEMIKHHTAAAKELGKILYVGEYVGELAFKGGDTDEERIQRGTEYINRVLPAILAAFRKYDVQISTYWSTYTYGQHGIRINELRPDSPGLFILDILKAHNDICNEKAPVYKPGYGEEIPADGLLGDIDGDSRVTAIDAVRLLRYLAGYEVPEVTADNADLNGDGKIGNRDVTVLLRKVAGWN